MGQPDEKGNSTYSRIVPLDEKNLYVMDNMIAYSEMISFLKYIGNVQTKQEDIKNEEIDEDKDDF